MLFANIFVCIFVYMLDLAGQTAEPNWLKLFEGTLGYPGGNIGVKFFNSELGF